MYENENALTLFNRVTTQFIHGFSGPTGLAYPAVKVVADAINIEFKKELDAIQTMEREYLEICSEKQEDTKDGAKI